jgi:hypothetical protein
MQEGIQWRPLDLRYTETITQGWNTGQALMYAELAGKTVILEQRELLRIYILSFLTPVQAAGTGKTTAVPVGFQSIRSNNPKFSRNQSKCGFPQIIQSRSLGLD